jgi:hypothetical protein
MTAGVDRVHCLAGVTSGWMQALHQDLCGCAHDMVECAGPTQR